MGVSVLQCYPVPADKTPPQVIELLTRRIVNLGATATGQFLVDCETYVSSSSSPPKTLHVLHDSEHPATVFSVLESQPGKPPVTFTSDTLFDLLLLKLGNVYAKKSKIESKGSRFEIGDFLVKLGVVSSGGSFKGILVEVEYLPCMVAHSCWGLIKEFMQGFIGGGPGLINAATPEPPLFKRKAETNSLYLPIDTIQQYLEHFANFRKVTSTSGAAAAGNQQVGQSPQRMMTQ